MNDRKLQIRASIKKITKNLMLSFCIALDREKREKPGLHLNIQLISV